MGTPESELIINFALYFGIGIIAISAKILYINYRNRKS